MRLLLASATLAALTVVGCGDDRAERIGVVHVAILPVDYPCEDSFADVYGPSKGFASRSTTRQRGKLAGLRARDGTIDADTVAADQHPDATTTPDLRDVDVYRIAYRTERLAQGPGQRDAKTTAVVLVPHGARSDDVLVVAGHGSAGMGPECTSGGVAPGAYHNSQPLAIAGEGWITIVPDLAGFGDPEAMQGYLSAEDEAHSMLDATRAAAELFMRTDSNPFKVVFVGLSQGGHDVLAAQARSIRATATPATSSRSPPSPPCGFRSACSPATSSRASTIRSRSRSSSCRGCSGTSRRTPSSRASRCPACSHRRASPWRRRSSSNSATKGPRA